MFHRSWVYGILVVIVILLVVLLAPSATRSWSGATLAGLAGGVLLGWWLAKAPPGKPWSAPKGEIEMAQMFGPAPAPAPVFTPASQ